MTGVHDLPLFVLAGLLLDLTPGPDMACIAGRAATGGFRAGAAARAGRRARGRRRLVRLRQGSAGVSFVALSERLALLERQS